MHMTGPFKNSDFCLGYSAALEGIRRNAENIPPGMRPDEVISLLLAHLTAAVNGANEPETDHDH